MAANFGVQLKSSDGGSPGRGRGGNPNCKRTELKTKPVSDLKAMFDKSDGDNCSKAFLEQSQGVSKTSLITSKTATTQNVKTGGTIGSSVPKTVKTDIVATSNFLSKNSKISDQTPGLTREDRRAFEALQVKLKETGVDKIDQLDDEPAPAVAVARTYSGGKSYSATVETKGMKGSVGGDEKVGLNKTDAVSFLSFNLTKLRLRPGSSIKSEKSLSRSNSIDEETSRPDSPRTESPRSSSPRPISPVTRDVKRDKYIPGVAKGWRGSGDESSGRSSPVSLSSSSKFSDSSIGKLQRDSITEENRLPGFRSVSPLGKNSGDESSASNGSAKRSPRNDKNNAVSEEGKNKRTSGLLKSDVIGSKKTDINENIKRFDRDKTGLTTKLTKAETTSSRSNRIGQTSLETKTETVAARRVNLIKKDDTKHFAKPTTPAQSDKDKTKVRSNRSSGSFSSDTEKGRFSPRGREGKGAEKKDGNQVALEQRKSLRQTHRPLSKSASTGSTSSMTREDASVVKARIQRFASPNSNNDSSASKPENRLSEDVLKSKYGQSRKMSADKFLDLKKGFETKAFEDRTNSPVGERKPKLDIKVNTRLLERKQSFESCDLTKRQSYERKAVPSPRSSGSVLDTIKSLNELDAKAKASPVIMRRTQSLPSDSVDDENDSSADYYEDLENYQGGSLPYSEQYHHSKLADDASNEGDISSEADLIYEEIPSGLAQDLKENNLKRDLKDRRATAFRKRKKEDPARLDSAQTGTDADIDSDSGSSNSGIYEPIEDEAASDSLTEDLPPELPPQRAAAGKKKKKKDEKATASKGFREKFKQLYKGKAVEGEVVGPQQQSAGLMSKFKSNLKKSKGGNSGTSLDSLSKMEENPVCESEGTDTDIDPEQVSLRSSGEKQSENGATFQLGPPPPLPPRHSAGARSGSIVESSKEYYGNVDVSDNSGKNGRTSPPLPPRNRVSNNIDLNLVIPVAPGGAKSTSPGADLRKSGWPPVKDSYLHSQKIPGINTTTSPDIPYMDASPMTSPSPDAPPLPQRPPPPTRGSSTDSYVDVTQKVPTLPDKTGRKSTGDSYVDVDLAPLPDSEYSLADEIRKELEKRPVSSAYIQANDLASRPPPLAAGAAPFQDMLRFRSSGEEDGLYIDLSDDQVYGTIGTRYKSKFESEELYQVYNQDKITRASKRKAIYSSFDESDEEGFEDGEERVYEDLSEYSSGRGSLDMDKKSEADNISQKSKISTLEMFGRKGTVLRTLWAEMPEVKSSGVLDTISPQERKIQESMFEIITSEATYLKSLNVLISVFLMSDEVGRDHCNKCVFTRQERHVVFSNIGSIRETSERFLADLECSWQKSVLLGDICNIIADHASKYFECYIHYCSNQTFQDRALTDLRKKPEVDEALKRLESHQDCQGLPMISFLLLPMQRVTRLPLLIDAICHRLDPFKDKERHKSAINAFNALSKVVRKCNDGAKKMQQTEQMYFISQQIAFTKEVPQIPLISASRFLVKQGEVTRISSEAGKSLFGKAKPGKSSIHVFLFSDILLLTKKKGNQYPVIDYCQRNAVHVETIDNPEKNTRLLPFGVPSGCKFLFLLVILENFQKQQVELICSANSLSDRARWQEAVTPVKYADDQRIYEEWDCPQVQCIEKYVATEPDELSLEESDVVNVFKKLEDGMYEGERLRDGERGWFPKENTVEIVNSHVRARNLRMKYRLLSASESK